MTRQCALPPPPHYALPKKFSPPPDPAVRIAFYNLENLFDTMNDPERHDDDFTPIGRNRWTYPRYRAKVTEHAQTIRAIGGWNGLDVAALAEIENRTVLESLIKAEPLRFIHYRIVHFDSPDPRGIDVALIYNANSLRLDTAAPVPLPVDPGERPLRDFLWCRFQWHSVCFHVMVVHWPSRYGGQKASEDKRFYAAQKVNEWADWIFASYPEEGIVLMGDFNDGPGNASLRYGLGTATDPARWILHAPPLNEWPGSHVHQGRWTLLDQCYLSRHFAGEHSRLKADTLHLFPARWLLEQTDQDGWIPFRTYRGPAYHGGVSDHLPIYFDLLMRF